MNHSIFLFMILPVILLNSPLKAEVCSHNYVTNRLEFRNSSANKLDLTAFNALEGEQIMFNNQEFIVKCQTTRYVLRSTMFFNTYYPSDIICIYLPGDSNPILILKEFFSFWIDETDTLKVIQLDSYVPQAALPFFQVVNFVNTLRECFSKQWHYLHLPNDPIAISSQVIQLDTRVPNILSENQSIAEKLGGKFIKWGENIHRETLPPILYNKGKNWLLTRPSLKEIEKELQTLPDSSSVETCKEFIVLLKNYGCKEASSLKEVYAKIKGSSAEKQFLSIFCNLNNPILNDMLLQACKKKLNPKKMFDQLIAIHILEEFFRLRNSLKLEIPLPRFYKNNNVYLTPISWTKTTPFAFYLEVKELAKTDGLGFKYNRYPSKPSIFMFDEYSLIHEKLREWFSPLTKEDIQRLYEDQEQREISTLNYDLPIEKKLIELLGDEEVVKLVNISKLRIFQGRDGETIAMMVDEAFNCLKNVKRYQYSNINKDEIWQSFYKNQNSSPLLTWYLIVAYVSNYDNFFVPLPLNWFTQAKEKFFNTYYTKEEDYQGKDIRR